MPTFENGPVSLHYETWGDGPAVLLLAPGGLRASRIDMWSHAPWNPIEALADRYLVVGMDQRNAGESVAPITAADGWASYTADQLALMDHLDIEAFSVLGMCIGGAFIMSLLALAPERIRAAVALQPVGFDGNRSDFRSIFEEWRTLIGGDHPEASDEDWEGCWTNLFGADRLLWSVPDELLPNITTPLLVLQGDDVYHPRRASLALGEKVATATLIERWKEPDDQPAARAAVDQFLAEHAA